MSIFPPNVQRNRRRTDQLLLELADTNQRIGTMRALALLRPALLAQDSAGALAIADELEAEVTAR